MGCGPADTSESYSYNAADNMTSKTVDSVTTSYTYDAIDQLLSETRSGYAASYTYDANGNRASRTVNGLLETYVNDAGDKLTSVTWTGGSKTYGYDAAGRTTSITTASGTTSLVYDYESRVTSITYPNASVDTFTYNGLDTRVGKAGAQGSFTFKRDGVDVTDPVLNDGAANYTPGVSERRSGTSKFNVSDYLGTNSRQLDSSQATSATRQYDAFGNLISTTGSPTGPFGFAGGWGYQEDASGLKLLGHRYYDSSTGKFLTRDPVKDGRNWYGYCAARCVRYVDPSGLSAFSIGIGAQAIDLFVSGSVQIGLKFDIDSGHVGLFETFGGGPGGGIVVPTPGLGFGYDAGGTVKDGFGQDSSATGMTVPIASFEILDSSGNSLGVGGSLGFGKGEGAGAFHEYRWTAEADITDMFGATGELLSSGYRLIKRKFEEFCDLSRWVTIFQ